MDVPHVRQFVDDEWSGVGGEQWDKRMGHHAEEYQVVGRQLWDGVPVETECDAAEEIV